MELETKDEPLEYDPDFVPTKENIIIDETEPEDHCCRFYAAFYYQIEENDTGDKEYRFEDVCLTKPMF